MARAEPPDYAAIRVTGPNLPPVTGPNSMNSHPRCIPATRPCVRSALADVALSGLLVACAHDTVGVDPVEPPVVAPSVRAELIAEAPRLVRERGLGPILRPPPVQSEIVELGRFLAFDKILSGNRDVSCMTCHLPAMSTDDGKSLSIGPGASGLGPERSHPDGDFTLRHSTALFNRHHVRKFLCAGEIEALAGGGISTPAGDHLTPEMQRVLRFGVSSAPGMFPVSAPEEMLATGNELAEGFGGDHNFTELWSRLMLRLGGVDEYRELFEAAYPGTALYAYDITPVDPLLQPTLLSRSSAGRTSPGKPNS